MASETVADIPGGSNGAALGPDGAVCISDNGGCFSWIEHAGMTCPGPLPHTWTGGSIDRVPHGGFWFTDDSLRSERSTDRTGIYYAKADASHIAEVVFPVDAPNGIGLSPSGDRVCRLSHFLMAPGSRSTSLPDDDGGLGHGAPALKRAPPPYPKDHPRADLLKHKSMTLYRNFGRPAWLHTAKAHEQIVAARRGCGNLNDWLAKQVGPSELPDSRR